MRRCIVGTLAIAALASWLLTSAIAQIGPNGMRFRNGRVIANEPPARTDDDVLAAAGLPKGDADALLGYLRMRTPSDADLERIRAVIERMGAEEFTARVAASREVEQFGPAAVSPLKVAATRHADPEVAYRAGEALRRLEKAPHDAVAAAAVRAVAKAAPAGAVPVLLGFYPLADTPAVADEIRFALSTLAFRAGRADPALLDALRDTASPRRTAAALALVRGAGAAERGHVAAVREAAVREPDADARFEVLFALMTVARDSASAGPMIDGLADLPRGRLWQAEDFLLQFAGADAPQGARFGKSAESVARARDAWKKWWNAKPRGDQFAAFRYAPRVTGRTLIVSTNVQYSVAATVSELGPDLKPRWQMGPGLLQHAVDAHYTADGLVAVAEHGGNRISVRSPDGRIAAQRPLGQGAARPLSANPTYFRVLPGGNFLVTSRSQVVEMRPDRDEEVMAYARNNDMDILGSARLDDGRTAVLLRAGEVLFLDAAGKPQEKSLKVGSLGYQGCLAPAGPGRILVGELMRLAEYDVNAKDAKPVWEKSVSNVLSAQRLPNGNTLVVEGGAGRLIEYGPGGEEVWSHSVAGEGYVTRAYRY